MSLSIDIGCRVNSRITFIYVFSCFSVDLTFCQFALTYKINIKEQVPKYIEGESQLCILFLHLFMDIYQAIVIVTEFAHIRFMKNERLYLNIHIVFTKFTNHFTSEGFALLQKPFSRNKNIFFFSKTWLLIIFTFQRNIFMYLWIKWRYYICHLRSDTCLKLKKK